MSGKSDRLSLQKLEQSFFEKNPDYDLNYCIPIYVGIISQDVEPERYSRDEVEKAVTDFGNRLEKLFGRFSARSSKKKGCNDSRRQLVLLIRKDDTGELTRIAAEKLKNDFRAVARPADSVEEIKRRSWMVLALWDGVAKGEIFEKVSFMLSGRQHKEQSDYRIVFPEHRPVFQIVLPADRMDIDDQKAEAGVRNYTLRDIYPRVLEKLTGDTVRYDRYHYSSGGVNRTGRTLFKNSARKIRRFNRTVIDFASRGTARSENVYDLFPDFREKHALSAASEAAAMRQICYDVISVKSQFDHWWEMTAVLGLAALGLLFYSMYSDLFPIDFFIYVFILLFSGSYLVHLAAVRLNGNQNCYLEFRAIAECMRVQGYWYAAGINESTGDYYRVKFSKDVSWAKYALNRWHEADTSGDRFDGGERDDLMLRKEWIDGQYRFFRQKKGEFGKRAGMLGAVGRISKAVWLLTAIALAVFLWNGLPGEGYLIFAIGALNVVTLVVSYLSEKLLYSEMVARYAYCALLAEAAVDDFNSRVADSAEIFKQYGIEALDENAEWLMIENNREPDVPNG